MQIDTLTYYLTKYDKLADELVDTFTNFDRSTFNAPLAPGKWSPGQMAQHLVLSQSSTIQLLQTSSPVVTEGRDMDAQCQALDEAMRLTHTPVETFPSFAPPQARYTLGDTLDKLIDTRAEIRVLVEFGAAAAGLITEYTHPLFGQLTVCEWLWYTAMHGERHRLQVDAVI